MRCAALRARRFEQSGYTLLELLLVVSILVGLMAVVWPRFAQASRALTVRAGARDLVALVGRGRLEALSRREPVEVRVAADSVTVVRAQPRVFNDDGSRRADEEEVVVECPLSGAVSIKRLQVLPTEVEFVPGGVEEDPEDPSSAWQSDDEVVITFYPDGTSDEAVIGLGESESGSDAPEYYVRVRGLVGRATVVRTLAESDEETFAEVQDAARDW